MRFPRLPTGAMRERTEVHPSADARGTTSRRVSTPIPHLRALCGMLALAFAAAHAALVAQVESSSSRWTMLHVQGQIGQADCHLVTLPDGRHVLIDAGEGSDAPGKAVSQLRRHGVSHLALAVISHFHADHYGQLLALLDAGITMDRVIVNVPGDRRIADREMPWGCDFDHVMATLDALRQRGVPYQWPQAGERLIECRAPDGVTVGIDVICAFDGINTPVGETDINDTSIILRLFHGTTRVLFTGDLNHALGAHLATGTADIGADLLKAPHHGTEGCAPNEFYDRVAPSAVLVPSPTGLWLSQRSSRTRNYFADRDVPTLVNGQHGNVTVMLRDGGYRIETEIRGFTTEVDLRPRILVQPVSAEVGSGANLTLAVTAAGAPTPRVTWTKNGVPIPGATVSTLTISGADADDGGVYRAIITNPHGRVESHAATVTVTGQPAIPPASILTNLSARGRAGAGDAVLIAGFVIRGQGSKTLLVRAVGPSLSAFGVKESLQDPRLALTTPDGRPIATNDNWSATADAARVSEAAAAVRAFALPSGSRDAAMVISLPAGAYTALAGGVDGASGVVLVELYDMESASSAHLVNLSARCHVDAGDAALIAGFVTEGTGEQRVLCRAVGPSLRLFNVPAFLPRPQLMIHQPGIDSPADSPALHAASDPIVLATATTTVGAFALESGAADAVSLLTLAPGLRTAVVSSADGMPGIALVELYRVP